jgi:S-adenosylmethionine/arginine decarboxylase-like enzyme
MTRIRTGLPQQIKGVAAAAARLPPVEPFGYLLTLDLYGCRDGVCNDLALCYRFLEALVAELRMTMQAPPFVFKSDHVRYPDKEGLSGWVPLVESGIQIHTLAPKNFISIDVYCCRKFSDGDIVKLAQGYFDCKAVEMNRIKRGVKYNEVQ